MAEPSFSQGGGWALVVAHRGASAEEAENTREAFQLAVEVGADAVELDVRLTADGVPVVMHDADVSRTTDGRGHVAGMSLAEVKRLRIRTSTGGATEVPTLREALEAIAGRVAVDIEVKNIPWEPGFDPAGSRTVEATLRVVDEAGAGEVIVTSFDPRTIARCRSLAPSVPTGLLTTHHVPAPDAIRFAASEGHTWVLPPADRVLEAAPAAIDAARSLGLRLGTWVVDDTEVALGLFRHGIDAVATNDPRALVTARG